MVRIPSRSGLNQRFSWWSELLVLFRKAKVATNLSAKRSIRSLKVSVRLLQGCLQIYKEKTKKSVPEHSFLLGNTVSVAWQTDSRLVTILAFPQPSSASKCESDIHSTIPQSKFSFTFKSSTEARQFVEKLVEGTSYTLCCLLSGWFFYDLA